MVWSICFNHNDSSLEMKGRLWWKLLHTYWVTHHSYEVSIDSDVNIPCSTVTSDMAHILSTLSMESDELAELTKRMDAACKWDENGQYYMHPAKAYVTRPSDALLEKLSKGTATDWVTRGRLRRLVSMVAQCTVGPAQALASAAMGQSVHMESMRNTRSSWAWVSKMVSPCGKVYSLAGILYMWCFLRMIVILRTD